MAWGWLKGLGKVAGGLVGLGGGGIDYDRLADLIGGGGAALGAGSQASASNRGNQFAGQMDLAQLLMARELAQKGLDRDADNDFLDNSIARDVEGRAGRQDAWRKLLSAQRVTNPAQRPDLTPYAAPRRERTDAERRGATALSEEAFARLHTGNPIAAPTRRDTTLGYDPMSTIDPSRLQAGTGETVSGWLGALLAGIGQSRDRRRPGYANNVPSGITAPPRVA